MIDYRSPVAEILFALEHGAEAARLPDWDGELAKDVLTQAARFVDDKIAPLDPIADATPSRIVDGRVKVVPAFVKAFAEFGAGGWPGLAVDEEYGGQGLPHVLASALSEMLSGACISFQMILSLAQGALRAVAVNGSVKQKNLWLPRLASGEWLASMCLTEAQAGSDLGLVRTQGVLQADGGYLLTGGKIFISGGDQDMTGKIMHLVLARTPDAPPGVKGLSLFLCPSELEDGSPNRVSAVRLEEKMGMHASPTCQMAFDGARAEIIGQPGEGLARMFTMMNAERMDVAIQGVGLMETALQRSLAYAAERRQGRTPGSKNSADSISRHSDVRRMLLNQMALGLGSRAMIYRTLVELELGESPALVEFMTPVCKAFATDGALEAANLAIQVHGGYGYLREYRVEQIFRDARITPIYEGTNGIQAMTLAGRLLRLDNGACVGAFRHHVEEASALTWDNGLTTALASWNEATEAMLRQADPGVAGSAYLRLTGLVAMGAAWARLEAAVHRAPNPARIRAAAAFFREVMLPETSHLARLCNRPLDIPEMAEAVFS
jgi:alkylation response protein AidB-like acyl-CoA dehydrogenase